MGKDLGKIVRSRSSGLQCLDDMLKYHEGGRLSDQQMALLQYQRENIHFLCEEILRLQECLSKYERSDDRNTPQVDLAHLLAARDQELRTLSAEMDQLQSELRLARSVISDKDAEIQRVRTTNNQPALSQPGIVQAAQRLSLLVGINTGAWKANPDQAIQYVEENERLRAILGEWSARTAKVASIPFLVITYKLERALEMEHISNLELQRKLAAVRSHYAEQTQQH
ncbi:hypothetical protein Cgig2_010841 [Carnegiea gigantea]|uniref:Uncharacterized protein n=1 Tax=Carnegiea gigantea TaxID=171969 RepID=A0A9Q1GPL7_9CARY|nr:hypothetical protein Cgig2_010841 [Carnegiea gigantea]